MPVREDVVANEGWATAPETYISNGRYTMTEWEHDSQITIVKNPNHWEADKVIMNEMKCFLSDDDNNVLTNWKNDTWRFIETYPTNEVEAIKAEYPNEFITVPSLGTYFLLFNMNEPLL
jgi:oligopeptide transport system substrate-binding protein